MKGARAGQPAGPDFPDAWRWRGMTAMLSSLVVLLAMTAPEEPGSVDEAAALGRGIDFLSREVPRWKRENQCYSCHNNGDGARALFAAIRAGMKVDARAVQDTLQWLDQPARWSDNGGDGEFSDKRLASLQFAAAQLAARSAGLDVRRASQIEAAEQVAAAQAADGSWPIDQRPNIGSPVTYGEFLATALAREVLVAAGTDWSARTARADRFLRESEPKTVLASAAVLVGLGDAGDDRAAVQRQACLVRLVNSANPDGGWGPYRTSRSEPFDTAVVLVALDGVPASEATWELIRRGRQYLIAQQEDDGGWPATTRPARGDSYAQRISTTAWAVMALLRAGGQAPSRR